MCARIITPPPVKARENSRYIRRELSENRVNRPVFVELGRTSNYVNRPATSIDRSAYVEKPIMAARRVEAPFVEALPVVVQPVEIQQVVTTPIETLPVDIQPVEIEPVVIQPVEVQPIETLPVDIEPVETLPAVVQPVEIEPVEILPLPMELIAENTESSEIIDPRKKLALLLPGHNEELIIATTIRSAVKAGQNISDIFVVNDASTDATRKIATELLGKQNVLNVQRSGKALAVKKAIKKFNIEQDYQWLHVADADSLFSPNYFNIFREKLTNEHVVAIGFVQSLRGNWISTYRAFSYTYGQHVFRRIQSALGMISVFPGPVTCFRTDILSKLDINGNNVTEDFDITLQVHRKKLGKIVFIPKAISYTQDPQSLRDFCKQSMRWYTGFFQGIQDYQIGRHKQRIDIGIGFQLLQTAFFLIQVCVLFPIVMIETHHWLAIPIAISIDFILTSVLTFLSAIAIKRWSLIGVLPFFYFLRIAELIMYFTAFFQVVVLKRYESGLKGWSTEGRRYKIASAALSDAA